MKNLRERQEKRKKRARLRLKKASLPRLSVFRSNKYIYGQIIDDKKGQTLVAASGKDLVEDRKGKSQKAQRRTEGAEKKSSVSSEGSVPSVIKKLSKIEKAKLVGKILAKKALARGIKKIVFDRGLYKYHGRVRALAEGAREGGLEF